MQRRLSEADIIQIIKLYASGVKKYAIAKRFHVDHTTIHYHLKHHKEIISKFLSRGVLEEDFDTWFKRQHQAYCDHPSFKCSLCGVYVDNMRTESAYIIKQLRERISYLESTLRSNRIPF